MKDVELRCGAHSWHSSELESKWFAADIINIPALSERKHLRKANRRSVQPLQEGGEVSQQTLCSPVELFLCQTIEVPSLGLRDKNRRSGERGKDWDLMTLQKPEETGKKESPTAWHRESE